MAGDYFVGGKAILSALMCRQHCDSCNNHLRDIHVTEWMDAWRAVCGVGNTNMRAQGAACEVGSTNMRAQGAACEVGDTNMRAQHAVPAHPLDNQCPLCECWRRTERGETGRSEEWRMDAMTRWQNGGVREPCSR
eukprot:364068-Chlamydomonas_euryale.AAC.9